MDYQKQGSAWQSLFLLLIFTLVCAFVTQFIAVIGYLLFSGDFRSILQSQDMTSIMGSKGFLYTSLMVSSLGTFLFPALLLQQREKQVFDYFPTERTHIFKLLLLTLLFLLAFNPSMEWISRLNQQMMLPDSLGGVEEWMRDKEDSMADLTENIVMVDNVPGLLLNILVMAIVPAIVEEYYFRGALQGILGRIIPNMHVAIWLTAIIFSAIHVQFYGFFPRMILGLIFGYAFYWSKNIWVPIFGHFINNFTVTLVAYYYQKQGKSFQDLQNMESYSTVYYILSVVFSIALGYYFYQVTHKKKIYEQSQLG